jgi:hypothetical protein
MNKFLHIGVPTTILLPNAIFRENDKVYISPPIGEFAIEYLKFEKESPMPEEVQSNIHIAFLVDNFEKLINENKLLKLWTNDKGKKMAFILHYGTVIELLEK